jgi:hypothetical protein
MTPHFCLNLSGPHSLYPQDGKHEACLALPASQRCSELLVTQCFDKVLSLTKLLSLFRIHY